MKRILMLFWVVAIISCDNEETIHSYVDIDPSAGINLQNLQVGDKGSYLLYQSLCDDNFMYTGDTLVVEIIERNDSLFLHEYYTEGSERTNDVEQVIIPKDGYVLIPQRFQSEFLFFYGNDSIFLDRNTNASLVQNGCRLFIGEEEFIGEEIGSVDQFQFGDYRVTNKKGISCVPGFFNIDAYIFYEDHLNVVHIISESETEANIFGFVAIQDND